MTALIRSGPCSAGLGVMQAHLLAILRMQWCYKSPLCVFSLLLPVDVVCNQL